MLVSRITQKIPFTPRLYPGKTSLEPDNIMKTGITPNSSTAEQTAPVLMPIVDRLIGSYEKSLDPKLRLVLPAPFRDKLGDHPLIMVRWLKRSLAIFPECNWFPMAQSISQYDLYDDFGLTVRNHFFGHAREIKMDRKEGRIIVPPDMADYARLDGKIIIMGDWDKITLWNYTYYQDQVAVDDVTFSERCPKVLKMIKGQQTLDALKAEVAQADSAARESMEKE